jgi:hypothetical protein
MEESFNITILHNGIEKELEGKLRISAYTHQFLFHIDDSEIVLERDDQGNFRAIQTGGFSEIAKKIDQSLVQALIKEMETIMNE